MIGFIEVKVGYPYASNHSKEGKQLTVRISCPLTASEAGSNIDLAVSNGEKAVSSDKKAVSKQGYVTI